MRGRARGSTLGLKTQPVWFFNSDRFEGDKDFPSSGKRLFEDARKIADEHGYLWFNKQKQIKVCFFDSINQYIQNHHYKVSRKMDEGLGAKGWQYDNSYINVKPKELFFSHQAGCVIGGGQQCCVGSKPILFGTNFFVGTVIEPQDQSFDPHITWFVLLDKKNAEQLKKYCNQSEEKTVAGLVDSFRDLDSLSAEEEDLWHEVDGMLGIEVAECDEFQKDVKSELSFTEKNEELEERISVETVDENDMVKQLQAEIERLLKENMFLKEASLERVSKESTSSTKPLLTTERQKDLERLSIETKNDAERALDEKQKNMVEVSTQTEVGVGAETNNQLPSFYKLVELKKQGRNAGYPLRKSRSAETVSLGYSSSWYSLLDDSDTLSRSSSEKSTSSPKQESDNVDGEYVGERTSGLSRKHSLRLSRRSCEGSTKKSIFIRRTEVDKIKDKQKKRRQNIDRPLADSFCQMVQDNSIRWGIDLTDDDRASLCKDPKAFLASNPSVAQKVKEYMVVRYNGKEKKENFGLLVNNLTDTFTNDMKSRVIGELDYFDKAIEKELKGKSKKTKDARLRALVLSEVVVNARQRKSEIEKARDVKFHSYKNVSEWGDGEKELLKNASLQVKLVIDELKVLDVLPRDIYSLFLESFYGFDLNNRLEALMAYVGMNKGYMMGKLKEPPEFEDEAFRTDVHSDSDFAYGVIAFMLEDLLSCSWDSIIPNLFKGKDIFADMDDLLSARERQSLQLNMRDTQKQNEAKSKGVSLEAMLSDKEEKLKKLRKLTFFELWTRKFGVKALTEQDYFRQADEQFKDELFQHLCLYRTSPIDIKLTTDEISAVTRNIMQRYHINRSTVSDEELFTTDLVQYYPAPGTAN